jgi:hypothetical protein
MSKEDAVLILRALNDGDLFYALRDIMQGRRVEYAEAGDEYGHATREAKLAVIRHILGE